MSTRMVAPPAGAWIETNDFVLNFINQIVAPPAGAWIETQKGRRNVPTLKVAPPAGAWIETAYDKWTRKTTASRLPQARGLKQALEYQCGQSLSRASRRRVD